MSATARASIRVARPLHELAPFVTDPHQALPVISGFGDFRYRHDVGDPGHQEWDVIYHVGTLQLGGRVEVDCTRKDTVTWRSIRGTRHTFAITVTEDRDVPDASVLTLEMDLSLSGLLMARIAERAGRGIMTRHLQAAAEQLRHHAEWELGE